LALIAVMSVYEEEGLIERAVKSLWDGGVDAIHVFDGAWMHFGAGPSTDRTRAIADDLGCRVHLPPTDRRAAYSAARLAGDTTVVYGPWENQETKRTAMFKLCGATWGDHVLVFDADEELEGKFDRDALLEGQHYNLMVRCVGPNDLPGIRGVWPRGDYCADYKPELRLFAWSDALHCKWPGGYWDFHGKIEPYATSKGDSALPVVEGVSFLHHGNDRTDERKQKKIDFYNVEHPRRKAIQSEYWRKERFGV
jgi:hypothetical protein